MRPSPQLAPSLRATAQLVLTRELLALAAADLAARIEAEMASNPALDWVEEPGASPSRRPPLDTDSTESDLHAPRSLTEYLIEQIGYHTSGDDFSIALELVGSLDQRGYLADNPADIAERLGLAEDDVLRVLPVVQSLDPPGIGARDVREALLIQLDQLEGGFPQRRALARRLIAEHWADLSRQAWPRLARALKTSEDVVRDAADFIRHNLAPYPAHTFWGDISDGALLTPDVTIDIDPRDANGAFQVTVLEATQYRLHVPRAIGRAGTNVPEVGEYVVRARLFIASLQQRWRTMARIVSSLADAQRDFVLHGSRHLKPLTQIQLADALDIHESTVSRTIRGKFARLPDGRIVPLAAFFATDAPAKETLRALVAGETTPLTDQELCDALAAHGHRLSRRTVAKYRADLGIPPAHRRCPRSQPC